MTRMKDIAEDLGISLVTVSKAFNNHSDISAATKERVLRRMRELNYQPSLHAQGLASGRSFMMGFIVPDLVHAFFSEVAKNLSSVLKTKGYGLIISSSDEDPTSEQVEIDQMIRRRVDVLLLASCQSNPDSLSRLSDQNIPYILIDRTFQRAKDNFVGTDDVLVGEMATEHLIGLGRRRIAHIGGQLVSPSIDRRKGYKNALARHKIRVDADYVVSRSRGDESGDITGGQAMERLLKLDARPDAVFCYNDPAAIGAMSAILDAGLRIPEDIAVVGCGNIRYSESLRVPLTSVDVSSSMLGETAGKLALQLVKGGKSVMPRQILVPPKLVVRQSSAGDAVENAGARTGKKTKTKSSQRLSST
ncbi:LacI family DNA-binding transcriptional regulator [Granulicella sp. L46]|uniref:LacI family DNA-binding transcriptional regulator n=1 Tax=Granulicella sp. L46 TaxID=1641865 RepID=UPI00131E3E6B|nr:LacI family DNA-binding transcriptional regulator [Granulicella sp. L46]